jgi:hypothetical protein
MKRRAELVDQRVEQKLYICNVEQRVEWASSWSSPEQEPPKSLLLGIGVMT